MKDERLDTASRNTGHAGQSGLREFLRETTVAERLKALRAPSPRRFIQAVLFNYSLIVLAICTATVVSTQLNSLIASGLVYVFAIVLIAARQHALLVLMHEGAHRSISRNSKLNDLLSDLLCGAPLLVSTRSYRRAHLAHHQNLNSKEDPDWCRKVDSKTERDQWLFPAQIPLWRLLAQLYSHSVIYLLRSLADNQKSDNSAPTSQEQTLAQENLPDGTLAMYKYLLYGAVGIALTLTGTWLGFALYWLAPMLLVLPLIMRVRSIAEHFALRHDHPLRQTRTVRAGWLERLLLAPHHIGLHIDHHLQASVPFYNLPMLHRLLLECPDYSENAHLNDGYFVRAGYKDRSYGPDQPIFSADLYGPPSVVLQTAGSDLQTSAEVATT